MENHSLRGYLNRRSVDELESLLTYCLQEENFANYQYVVMEIFDILKDRVAPETYLKLTHRAKELLSQYESSF